MIKLFQKAVIVGDLWSNCCRRSWPEAIAEGHSCGQVVVKLLQKVVPKGELLQQAMAVRWLLQMTVAVGSLLQKTVAIGELLQKAIAVGKP